MEGQEGKQLPPSEACSLPRPLWLLQHLVRRKTPWQLEGRALFHHLSQPRKWLLPGVLSTPTAARVERLRRKQQEREEQPLSSKGSG